MFLIIVFLWVNLLASFTLQNDANLGENQYQTPIPQNYTLDEDLRLNHYAEYLLLSHDSNWILYRNGSLQSMTFYFRSRTQWQSFESQVHINQQDEDAISAWTFNKKGDLLLIGTKMGLVYKCKFSAKMTDSDCKQNFVTVTNLDVKVITAIDVNQRDQIVLFSGGSLFVLNVTQVGNLVQQAYFQYPADLNYRTKWHPKDQQVVIVAAGNPKKPQEGMLLTFNSSSNKYSPAYGPYAWSVDVFSEGDRFLVGNNVALILYSYTNGSYQFLGQVSKMCFADINISEDGKLVVGFIVNDGPGKIGVFTANRTTSGKTDQVTDQKLSPNQSKSVKSSINNIAFTPDISMKNFINISTDFTFANYAVSSDANEILIPDQNLKLIRRFTLCTKNTYLFNLTCLKCSSNCSTCHRKADLCLTCPNTTYALENGICVNCSLRINACLTCANTSFCLSCDSSQKFNSTPVNGACVCQNFSYLHNDACLDCGSGQICTACNSQTQCLTCNADLHWNSTPANGDCVCQDFYYNKSNLCTPCDSYGACKQCESQNSCQKCDYSQGYEETPQQNQTCVCRNLYSTVNFKCILCSVPGCMMCLQANRCSDCSQDQGYQTKPDEDGSCVKKSVIKIIFIITGVVIVSVMIMVIIYCKWKKRRDIKRKVDILREEEEPSQEKRIKQNFMAHKIRDIDAVNYSDEQRIRMATLLDKSSLLSYD